MPTDIQLVQQAQRGDPQAFSELAQRVRPWLLAFVWRQLQQGDDAEDVTQLALLKAYRHLPKLSQPDKLESWLRRIALNECHRWRRRAREVCSLEELAESEALLGPSPEGVVCHQETAAAVAQALAELPPQDRQLVEAFYLAGESYAEIEARTQLSHSALGSRLHRIRQRLRMNLKRALLWLTGWWTARTVAASAIGEAQAMPLLSLKKALLVLTLSAVSTLDTGLPPMTGPTPTSAVAGAASVDPGSVQPVPAGSAVKPTVPSVPALQPAPVRPAQPAPVPTRPVQQAAVKARRTIPLDHWMYWAFEDLRQAGLLPDYPAAGARPELTRAELAQAVAGLARGVKGATRPVPLQPDQARRVWKLINSLQWELKREGVRDTEPVKRYLLPQALPPDVPEDHWAALEVAELFAEGILEGYPGGTFEAPEPAASQPKGTGREAEAEEKPATPQPGRRFTDLPAR